MYNMKRILVILHCVISLAGFSQTSTFYYTSFGADGDDKGNSIIQALDTGFIIVGVTSSFGASQTDVYIARTDKLMQPKWQKTIGGFASEVGTSVVELNDSSLVVLGYTNSYGSGGYDAFIFRCDKQGELIWQKTFGGTDWDFGNSINKTLDGNLIICGSTFSYGRGDRDGFILKMDYNGNFLWNKVFGGGKEDNFKEVIPTTEGGYIATGITMSYGDSLGDIWIAKIDNVGDSTYFFTKGGNKRDIGNSIILDNSGNYMIAGGTGSITNGQEDVYIFKMTPSYGIMWERTYGLPNADEEAFCVKNSTSNKGSLMICYTTKEVSAYKKDAKALLLDWLGYYVDGGRVGSFEDEEVFSISNCFDKGYVLAGYTKSFNSLLQDVFVIKFDSLVNGMGQYVVGLNENQSAKDRDYEIYPNPFKDYLIVETKNSNLISKIEIISLQGQLVYSRTGIETDKFRISSLNLSSGIYTLRVISKQNTYTCKIFCN